MNNQLNHYIELKECEKTSKLIKILDNLEFNQVLIFVSSSDRVKQLYNILKECHFSVTDDLNDFNFARILVTTGDDVCRESINIKIYYDMTEFIEFNGLSICFISSPADKEKIAKNSGVTPLEKINIPFESYMNLSEFTIIHETYKE